MAQKLEAALQLQQAQAGLDAMRARLCWGAGPSELGGGGVHSEGLVFRGG